MSSGSPDSIGEDEGESRLEATREFISSLGLGDGRELMKRCRSITKAPNSTLKKNVETLKAEIGEECTLTVMQKNLMPLWVSNTTLSETMQRLKELLTPEELPSFLVQHPNVLTLKWPETVEPKLDYVARTWLTSRREGRGLQGLPSSRGGSSSWSSPEVGLAHGTPVSLYCLMTISDAAFTKRFPD
jgi:hypothetical protein